MSNVAQASVRTGAERVDPAEASLHASAVAIGTRGLLILGQSGSGKTRLALELVALGAELVADDRVMIARFGEIAVMRPPARIAGLVELRGAGVIRHPHRASAPLWLAVDLGRVPDGRMPGHDMRSFAGIDVPVLAGVGAYAAGLAAILRTGSLPDPEAIAGSPQ